MAADTWDKYAYLGTQIRNLPDGNPAQQTAGAASGIAADLVEQSLGLDPSSLDLEGPSSVDPAGRTAIDLVGQQTFRAAAQTLACVDRRAVLVAPSAGPVVQSLGFEG